MSPTKNIAIMNLRQAIAQVSATLCGDFTVKSRFSLSKILSGLVFLILLSIYLTVTVNKLSNSEANHHQEIEVRQSFLSYVFYR